MDNSNGNGSGKGLSQKAKYALLAAAAAVLVCIIVVVVAVTNSRDSGESGTQTADNGSAVTEETEVPYHTPVFMYFVSKNDEGYTDYMAMIEELKAEYDGRVTFDIVDVDEEPESKENFPVEGNTPMLIMTNTVNDISAMEFKCSDKETLKNDIERSLTNTTAE